MRKKTPKTQEAEAKAARKAPSANAELLSRATKALMNLADLDLFGKRQEAIENRRIEQQLARYDELLRLLHDECFRQDLLDALRQPLEVIVLGGMSSGKSTLINALMHRPLLPARNEACTALVFKIEDNDALRGFRARSINGSKTGPWVDPITKTRLDQWNAESSGALVELEGNLPSIRNSGGKLVLYDTPGPNNARNRAHAKVTRKLLRDGAYGQILYMLDATQLGIDSERNELTPIFRQEVG